MEPLFEHRQRFAGHETRVLELEGDGTPLVLFHGFADSADTWRLVLDRLARAERRALAVDLPGFAAAAALEPGPVLPQLDAFAAAVVESAAGEGSPVVAAGNSLGGAVALRLAQRAGKLPLAGAVPIAPAGLDMARWFVLVERDPVLRTLLAVPAPLPEAVVREVVGRVYRVLAFARPAAVDRQVVDAFTSHHRDRATVRRYLDAGRRVLPELARCFELERVACPVLVVWGERDRMVSPRGAARIAEAIPAARIEMLAGIGHCPQIEAADRVASLLLDFPARLARAA